MIAFKRTTSNSDVPIKPNQMNFVWIFVLIMLALLYVYRSSTSRIVSLAAQVETLKNSAAANTMTPEDVDSMFDKKMREFEQKRVEAVRQMREAHAKHAETQGTTPAPFAVVPPPTNKVAGPVGPPAPSTMSQTKPKPSAIIKLPTPSKPDSKPEEDVTEIDAPEEPQEPKESNKENKEPQTIQADGSTSPEKNSGPDEEVLKEPTVRRRRTIAKT